VLGERISGLTRLQSLHPFSGNCYADLPHLAATLLLRAGAAFCSKYREIGRIDVLTCPGLGTSARQHGNLLITLTSGKSPIKSSHPTASAHHGQTACAACAASPLTA
jgi:hypothetical protein